MVSTSCTCMQSHLLCARATALESCSISSSNSTANQVKHGFPPAATECSRTCYVLMPQLRPQVISGIIQEVVLDLCLARRCLGGVPAKIIRQ
jgi:hypothetical protein